MRETPEGLGRQGRESLEVNREGFGERVVPGAFKALINGVKKKAQRKGGRPGDSSKGKPVLGHSQEGPVGVQSTWLSLRSHGSQQSKGSAGSECPTKRQQWLFNCAEKWRNLGIHSFMKHPIARDVFGIKTVL